MRGRCPTPFKFRFPSRREARLAALDIAERRSAKTGRKRVSLMRCRIYECGCGGYHLASGKKMALRGAEVPEMGAWWEP